jgi:F0F1-type ATP synthase membrane subunit a
LGHFERVRFFLKTFSEKLRLFKNIFSGIEAFFKL